MKLFTANPYIAAIVIAAGSALLMIVANGAVGIIGSEDNPINLLFSGVVVLGLVGASIARFRPLGMARAMYAMATALLMVAAYLAVAGHGLIPVVTLVFGGAWILAGRLFQRAAAR
jgi:hypothetical protein